MVDLTDGRYELKEATLYTAFRRLEEAGCIRSYWGDEATGARRRYYAITEAGFGADLGAEKFLDIKCRMAGLLIPRRLYLIY